MQVPKSKYIPFTGIGTTIQKKKKNKLKMGPA